MSDGVALVTIQRPTAGRWPITLEWGATDGMLTRADGELGPLDGVLAGRLARDELGKKLGEAVFRGDVTAAFAQARGKFPTKLRLLLRVEDGDLAKLRWEWLHAPMNGELQPAGLDERLTFARLVPSRSDRDFPLLARDARTLCVLARPRALGLADVAESGVDTIVQEVIPGAIVVGNDGTIVDLKRIVAELRQAPCGLLVLAAHGRAGERGHELLLAGDRREPVPIFADSLVAELVRFAVPLPRAVILLVCDSALETGPAWTDLGSSLVYRVGIPAVIAMAGRFTFDSARPWLRTFLEAALVDGDVERATAAARVEIALEDDALLPVLSVRWGGHRLFADGAAPGAPVESGTCPYAGLRPFSYDQRAAFYRKTPDPAELAARLARDGFLAIAGASGSGKSSLLTAGVIPALEETTPDLAWELMRPGTRPTARLDAALAKLAEAGKPRSLLVIDQFEELFTSSSDAALQRLFLDRLVDLIDDGATWVALTVRADFYHACIEHAAFGERFTRRLEPLRRMGRTELRDAIVHQAESAGLRIEPGLADAVIDDAGDAPGAMPLVQHVMAKVWERRRDRTLLASAYEAVGKVERALEESGEAFWTALPAADLPLARAVLLRLVVPADESDAAAQIGSRRRLPIYELGPADQHARITELVKLRADPMLLVTSRNPVTGDEEVELGHDELLRSWKRLRTWIEEDVQIRPQRELLERRADEFRDDPDETPGLRDDKLRAMLDLVARGAITANDDERAYLDACVAAEASERRRWWAVVALVGLVAAALIAVGSVFVVTRNHDRALTELSQHSADVEAASAHYMRSQLAPPDKRDLALLLAASAATGVTPDEPVDAAYQSRAIQLAREAPIPYGRLEGVEQLEMSEDGRHVVGRKGNRCVLFAWTGKWTSVPLDGAGNVECEGIRLAGDRVFANVKKGADGEGVVVLSLTGEKVLDAAADDFVAAGPWTATEVDGQTHRWRLSNGKTDAPPIDDATNVTATLVDGEPLFASVAGAARAEEAIEVRAPARAGAPMWSCPIPKGERVDDLQFDRVGRLLAVTNGCVDTVGGKACRLYVRWLDPTRPCDLKDYTIVPNDYEVEYTIAFADAASQTALLERYGETIVVRGRELGREVTTIDGATPVVDERAGTYALLEGNDVIWTNPSNGETVVRHLHEPATSPGSWLIGNGRIFVRARTDGVIEAWPLETGSTAQATFGGVAPEATILSADEIITSAMAEGSRHVIADLVGPTFTARWTYTDAGKGDPVIRPGSELWATRMEDDHWSVRRVHDDAEIASVTRDADELAAVGPSRSAYRRKQADDQPKTMTVEPFNHGPSVSLKENSWFLLFTADMAYAVRADNGLFLVDLAPDLSDAERVVMTLPSSHDDRRDFGTLLLLYEAARVRVDDGAAQLTFPAGSMTITTDASGVYWKYADGSPLEPCSEIPSEGLPAFGDDPRWLTFTDGERDQHSTKPVNVRVCDLISQSIIADVQIPTPIAAGVYDGQLVSIDEHGTIRKHPLFVKPRYRPWLTVVAEAATGEHLVGGIAKPLSDSVRARRWREAMQQLDDAAAAGDPAAKALADHFRALGFDPGAALGGTKP